MMKIHNLAFFVALALTGNAFAQIAPATPAATPKLTQSESEANSMLREYASKHKGSGSTGHNMLEIISTKGLPRTAENVNLVRSTLASAVTDDERVELARILGQLHSENDAHGLNKQIETDLKSMISANRGQSSRAATFAYVRSGYNRDSLSVLGQAKSKKMLDNNEYYGELAHLFNFAASDDQIAILSEIDSSKNRYGMEILASGLQSGSGDVKATPEVKAALVALLNKNEPMMPMAIGEFGYVDSIRYTNWLHKVSMLQAQATGTAYETLVLNRLNSDAIDPRKIMAFLISDEGDQFIRKVGKKAAFDPMMQKISIYSKQLPGNKIMRDAVLNVGAKIAALKA